VYRVQAAALQHDLARVGVAVDVRSSEFQTLFADVVRGNFQLYTLQFVGVTDPDMLRRVFHSAQEPPAGLNRVFYRNPETDRLIEQASSAETDDERLRFYSRPSRSSQPTCRTCRCGTGRTWPSINPTCTACGSRRLPITRF
jgi:ABC-type transport system substrate-binding protein